MVAKTPISSSAHADLSDRLRVAVTSAALRDAKSMELLRKAVGDFTSELRDSGLPPERVLVALKGVVNNRALPVILPTDTDWNGYLLREKIVTWCIEEYFTETSA